MARSWARRGPTDPVGLLIAGTDRLEGGFDAILRGTGRMFAHRSLGLTTALAWRAVAALTGIGLTAALVSGLSAGGGEARLASLTTPLPAEGPAIRDVRLQPRPSPLGEEGWAAITRPLPMFSLDSPELERQPVAYEARRSLDGKAREDVLSFGRFDEPPPHLALRLTVAPSAEPTPQSFVIALVRMAAQRGISVQRSGAATTIETKFGTVETTDATLTDGATSRACIGFRHVSQAAHPDMTGWWCGGATRPADRQQLICMVDRLDLLAAGDDRALRTAFARTELNRQPACSPPRLSATGRKASWLDADAKPPALKTATRR